MVPLDSLPLTLMPIFCSFTYQYLFALIGLAMAAWATQNLNESAADQI